MFRIVAPGPIGAAFASQYPGIVQRVPRTSHYGMIAAWNQDGIPMLDRIGVIKRLGIVRAGVNAHEAESLPGLDLEVVHLFHRYFRWRGEAVMLVRRTARPSAGLI